MAKKKYNRQPCSVIADLETLHEKLAHVLLSEKRNESLYAGQDRERRLPPPEDFVDLLP